MNPQQPYPNQGPDPQANQPPVNPQGSLGGYNPYSQNQPTQAQMSPQQQMSQQPGSQFQPQQQQQPQSQYQPYSQPSSSPVKSSGSAAKKWIITSFVFIFLTIALGGLSGWALVNYFDQKNNVDSKVSSAVSLAVKEQKVRDSAERVEAEKEPNRIFATGDDLGQLSFKYPKNWSVYEAASQDSSKYAVSFNPGMIEADSSDTRYALRLYVATTDYDKVVASYEKPVSSGALKATQIKINDQSATRFDGEISKDVRGSLLVFKLRDKTVFIQTDAETFTKDFDALISTITFNK